MIQEINYKKILTLFKMIDIHFNLRYKKGGTILYLIYSCNYLFPKQVNVLKI